MSMVGVYREVRELAEMLGVTGDMVINWEIRDIKHEGRNLERVRDFLKI
jgi:DNA-binding transcriptional regulator YiaG